MKTATQKTDYNQQAADFLQATGTEFKAEFLKHAKHFDSDKEARDIYGITLKRGARSYFFEFGQSINASGEYQVREHLVNKLWCQQVTGGKRCLSAKEFKALKWMTGIERDVLKNVNFSAPSAYDVLACLTKNDPGTFENFCSEFGYDADSRSAKKTYKEVCDEWKNVAMLFNDEEINELQEIQ